MLMYLKYNIMQDGLGENVFWYIFKCSMLMADEEIQCIRSH